MSIAELRETVRFILGDHDPDQPMFTDNAVDAAVRSALTLRKVPALSLDPARTGITPEPTADQVALVCFHTAKLWLAGDPDKYEYRTRALAEKFGGSRNAMDELEQSIHELENGTMFSGWVMFGSWIEGLGGLHAARHWTQMGGQPPSRTLPYPTLTGGG